MPVKPYIFLGVLSVAVAGTALSHSSYAQNSDTAASPIVLAQNSKRDEPGFFGKLFNRSDKTTKAKPLFLDDPKASNNGRRKGITPYDYSSRGGNKGSSRSVRGGDSLIEQQIAKRNERIKEQTARQDRLAQEINARIEGRLAQKYRDKDKEQQQAAEQKIRVYDPNKVWKQNNRNQQPQGQLEAPSEGRSRLYNSRN